MVAALIGQPHPIAACAEQLSIQLAEVADLQPVYMRPEDKRSTLLTLARAQAQLDELRLRVMAASADVAEVDGARDIAAWTAHHTHADTAPLRADQHVAAALDTRWSRVRAGMAAGTVSLAQAKVIAAGLAALPDHLDPAIVVKAEAHLVALAADHRPSELRILARRILDVVAPEIADAEEAKRLEREEQQAQEKCRLSLRPTGEGTTRITGLLPDPVAARLRTYLESFTSPRKSEGAFLGEEDRIPYPRRLGQAFCALLEHLDPHELPHHGGDATTVMVTIGLDALQTELGVGAMVGAMVGGEPMSASSVRRLACNARIIPAVLGGKSEVLDLGRSRRLFNAAQRKALRLRDQRCRAEGCTIPATWTEAHHWHPWSRGGNTDLDDGVLLCSHHHHHAHDPRYDHQRLANGDIRFHRRT